MNKKDMLWEIKKLETKVENLETKIDGILKAMRESSIFEYNAYYGIVARRAKIDELEMTKRKVDLLYEHFHISAVEKPYHIEIVKNEE